MEVLANILRPEKLSDIIGQTHLIGKDKVITNLVNNNHLVSMILYGKPGTGKTSIANAIVNELDIKKRFLNATTSSKKDFDIVIAEAKMEGHLVLVIDEIHRMNKDKQDLLLPYIEMGLVTLIGLTTSNPYHSINPAIRSRVQLFELHELTKEDIKVALDKGINKLEGTLDEDAKDLIANLANGDARFALNLLEATFYSINDKHITIDKVKNINSKKAFLNDKDGDGHYDLLSALQKSIRGSDVDASLHYLARLIEEEDIDSIARRLSVIVYEDIGLANPAIGPKLDSAINAAERIGFPEARIPLGEIVCEMALSPKSNSAYLAINKAITDLEITNFGNVPDNIKTNSKTYKYAHDYKNDWVEQNYMPKGLENKKYYIPKNNLYENNLYKNYLNMKGIKYEKDSNNR